MVDLALTITYSALALFHCTCVGLAVYVMIIDKMNIVHKIQSYLLFMAVLPIFVTDIVLLVDVSGGSLVDSKVVSTILDVFAILVYQSYFPHFIIGKMSSLLKGLAPSFYSMSARALVVKFLFTPISILIGVVFVYYYTNKNYIPVFLCGFFLLCEILNLLFLIIIFRVYSTSSAIIPDKDNNESRNQSGKYDSTNMRSDSNNNTSSIRTTKQSQIDSIQRETLHNIASFGVTFLIYIILSIVLVTQYPDGSDRSGYIMSVSWRFVVGLTVIITEYNAIQLNN